MKTIFKTSLLLAFLVVISCCKDKEIIDADDDTVLPADTIPDSLSKRMYYFTMNGDYYEPISLDYPETWYQISNDNRRGEGYHLHNVNLMFDTLGGQGAYDIHGLAFSFPLDTLGFLDMIRSDDWLIGGGVFLGHEPNNGTYHVYTIDNDDPFNHFVIHRNMEVDYTGDFPRAWTSGTFQFKAISGLDSLDTLVVTNGYFNEYYFE